jgi:DNA-binding MarR family transcriptional regulator
VREAGGDQPQCWGHAEGHAEARGGGGLDARAAGVNIVDGVKPGKTSAANTTRVGYLVYRVERRLRARIDQAVRAHGVTATEFVTLSVLRERDGLSCAQLARLAFVTPQAMNLVVSALERRQLVQRQPDPDHRRVLRASVTPEGLDVLERCDRSMDEIEGDMLADLPPEMIETVREALASCARSLEGARSLVPR